jgi:hypothetical protein
MDQKAENQWKSLIQFEMEERSVWNSYIFYKVSHDLEYEKNYLKDYNEKQIFNSWNLGNYNFN